MSRSRSPVKDGINTVLAVVVIVAGILAALYIRSSF